MSPKEYNIGLFGGGAVGKSAIIIRFVSNHYVDCCDPTIEDSYTKRFVVDGEERFLDILDTAGNEEYSALREQYIRETQGFILVYTITSLGSFNYADELREQIVGIKGTYDLPFVLVGCKCDLANDRQVSFDQGEELAQKWGCPFFEVSAKENIHVEDVFAEIVRVMDEYEKTHPGTVAVKEVESEDNNKEKLKKKEKKKRSFNPFNKYKFMDDI